MSNAEEQARKDWELAQGAASTTEGLVVRHEGDGFVLVDMAGIQQIMPWVGSQPWPGDRVRVVSAGLRPFCVQVHGAPLGTVSTVAGTIANVTGDDGLKYSWPYLGAAPGSGARVRIDHVGRAITGSYSADPPGIDRLPAVIPPAQGGQAWFNPSWSGNWRSGVFGGDPAQISDTRTAAYGYGTQVADTIPDTATIIQAELHLAQDWDNVPGVNSSLGVHGYGSRPGSFNDADLAGTISVPGGDVAVNIMGTFADGLKTGTFFGVGFRSTYGYRQYKAAPLSGRLFLKWS